MGITLIICLAVVGCCISICITSYRNNKFYRSNCKEAQHNEYITDKLFDVVRDYDKLQPTEIKEILRALSKLR